MKHLFFVCTIGLLSFCAIAQGMVNKPAPPINLQSILQGSNDARLNKLPAGFVLLEFWSTWCTPCVKNIPHLNELQEKFKNRNIRFISVTDEPKEKIEQFLQKRKMNGWVGIDNNGKTFANYKIDGRPETFIINDKGIIVFQGYPSQVTEQLLNDILAGNNTGGTVKEEDQETNKLGSFGGGEDPAITANFNMSKMGYLHQEVIRRSVKAGYGYTRRIYNGLVGISIIGADISHAIAYIHELPSHQRIINRSSISDTATWDFIFSRSKGYDMERARKELFSLACRTFSVAAKDSDVVTEVFVPQYAAAKKLIHEKDIKEDDPQIRTYQRLDRIFNSIETKTGTIVNYSAGAGEFYLDVFELGNKYFKLTGPELITWLAAQGVTLETKNEQVKLTVLYNAN